MVLINRRFFCANYFEGVKRFKIKVFYSKRSTTRFSFFFVVQELLVIFPKVAVLSENSNHPFTNVCRSH